MTQMKEIANIYFSCAGAGSVEAEEIKKLRNMIVDNFKIYVEHKPAGAYHWKVLVEEE